MLDGVTRPLKSPSVCSESSVCHSVVNCNYDSPTKLLLLLWYLRLEVKSRTAVQNSAVYLFTSHNSSQLLRSVNQQSINIYLFSTLTITSWELYIKKENRKKNRTVRRQKNIQVWSLNVSEISCRNQYVSVSLNQISTTAGKELNLTEIHFFKCQAFSDEM